MPVDIILPVILISILLILSDQFPDGPVVCDDNMWRRHLHEYRNFPVLPSGNGVQNDKHLLIL
jgi:hypothetical protein